MTAQTTRRAALGALLAAPAVAALGASAAMATLPASRAEWDHAFRAMERAKAICDHEEARHDIVARAYEAEAAAVPHFTVEFGASSPSGGAVSPLSTADPHEVIAARHRIKNVKEYGPDYAPYMDASRRLVGAAEVREARINEIDQRHDYTASHDRFWATVEAFSDAESTLIEMPAPDAQAFLWKLERLFGEDQRDSDSCGGAYCAKWVNALMADARRLLSGEA